MCRGEEKVDSFHYAHPWAATPPNNMYSGTSTHNINAMSLPSGCARCWITQCYSDLSLYKATFLRLSPVRTISQLQQFPTAFLRDGNKSILVTIRTCASIGDVIRNDLRKIHLCKVHLPEYLLCQHTKARCAVWKR